MANKAKEKGSRFEREITKAIPGAKKVIGSGAFGSVGEHLRGDVQLENGKRIECKVRKGGFKTIYSYFQQDDSNYVAIKSDYQQPLIIMSLDEFVELLEKQCCGGSCGD